MQLRNSMLASEVLWSKSRRPEVQRDRSWGSREHRTRRESQVAKSSPQDGKASASHNSGEDRLILGLARGILASLVAWIVSSKERTINTLLLSLPVLAVLGLLHGDIPRWWHQLTASELWQHALKYLSVNWYISVFGVVLGVGYGANRQLRKRRGTRGEAPLTPRTSTGLRKTEPSDRRGKRGSSDGDGEGSAPKTKIEFAPDERDEQGGGPTQHDRD